MKVLLRRLMLSTFIILVGLAVCAQKEVNTTTIILVRHAEKDTAKISDPELTAVGKERAIRLPTVFPNNKPDEMYSTPYIRTRETLKPWADAAGVEIKEYNPSNQPEFAEKLRQQKGKTIVVSGHSNTIPALVNLLINKDMYTPLNDATYNVIFIVTILKGKAKAQMMEY